MFQQPMTSSSVRFSLLFILFSLSVSAQQTTEGFTNYFIVIGAFDNEQNALRSLARAEEANLPARYAVHPEKKRYYVYVRLVTNLSLARETVKSVRQEGYQNAWIYSGDLLSVKTLARIEPLGANESPVTVAQLPLQTATHQPKDEQVEETKFQEPAIVQTPPTESRPDNQSAETNATPPAVIPAGKPFLFKLETKDGKPVTGLVKLQESDRANQFNPFETNSLVYLTAPKNRAGRWYVVCEVVGYRPYRVQFNYKDIEKVMGVGSNGEHVLPLELIPVKRGDYVELELVHFYTNSNIFTKESRRELDELVAMMSANPSYRIRVHGHTNGNDGRDIVSADPGQNLFDTDPSNRKFSGSAKELSTLRAESVKRYLTENGVDAARIQVKGEGGKQMLFEGTMASLNDRVEVEILKH